MEAMAIGLPLVVSCYPNSDERVIDGENAVLVSPRNTEALAEALRILLADPERRSRIGGGGAATARESMGWQAIVPIYERCYNLLAP
jgi:glycosyltransferase involved in cell wall biosynthesis